MDIQHLVDRLEDLIDEGRHLFGTKYTLLDEERILEIIDQMRISIPEEIEKSARIIAQRDRILAEAHEEAARVVQQHRERAEKLIDESAQVQAAQARADAILESARQDVKRIKSEADQYVVQLLSKLEQQLVRNLNEVRNGITYVQDASSQPTTTSEIQSPSVVHIPRPNEMHYVDADLDNGYKSS